MQTTCPNLGWLTALLAVSPKHSWSNIVIPALLESLDRSVIWACKEHQELIECYKKPEAAGGEDETPLDRVFETTRVPEGIIAFHTAFMITIARPGKLPLEKVMDQADSMYGYASQGQIKHIQSIIKRSQEIKTWQEYCKLIGAQPCIGKLTFEAFMTKQLRQSCENSLAKSYHKKDTDFSRIQASGVSQILLKGRTYTAPPNIRFMHVKDTRCEEGLNFLDMSLLVYHFDGHCIYTVNYRHRRSIGTHRIGAVTHSGDIIMPDDEFRTGGRKMAQLGDIDFEGLGKHVKEAYLLASAWCAASLADFRQPQIILSDPIGT